MLTQSEGEDRTGEAESTQSEQLSKERKVVSPMTVGVTKSMLCAYVGISISIV